jgi:dienelactone hydrolase
MADDDLVAALEVQKSFVALYPMWTTTRGYRQRAIQHLVLDAETHDLVSGDAHAYTILCGSRYDIGGSGVGRIRYYEFSYDAAAGELSYSVESGTRRWERVLESAEAPVVMLNYQEYPFESFGIHSPLTALLLAERYDWAAGGAQTVPIFSPEMERIYELQIEADGADTLVVRYPIDDAHPPWESWMSADVFDTNAVAIRYEYGIPASMGSRSNLVWTPVYAPFTELNLYFPAVAETVGLPALASGGEPITTAAGDVTLHGVVDLPAGPGPHPAVVMIPGWDRMTRLGELGAIDLYAQLAQRLVAAGVATARFDARGTAEGDAEAFAGATVAELAADAAAAVQAVQAHADVDPDRVFLLTTGPGVHVAAGAAAAVGLAGIAVIAPVGGAYADAALAINERYLKTNGNTSDQHLAAANADLADLFEALADGTYESDVYLGHTVAAWQSLLAEDLVASPIALPPLLILYGTEDHLVPQALVDELDVALGGEEPPDGGVDGGLDPDAGAIEGLTEVTAVIIPGLSHALTPGTAYGLWPEHGAAEAVDDGAVDALTDWLAATAGGL